MKPTDSSAEKDPERYSRHRLSAAFAQLTGAGKTPADAPDADNSTDIGEPNPPQQNESSISLAAHEALSPQMIVEGMLFVGTADGRSQTSREMARHIRDVSPKEVDQIVCQLNEQYHQQGVAYRIVGEGAGYRMQVAPQWESVRDRFGGRMREAKLTPSAIEVLSIVAYRQPVAASEINQLRDSRSQRILSHLVRRQLLSLHRPEGAGQRAVYQTTERFNRLFRISSPADLPSSEDLDDG